MSTKYSPLPSSWPTEHNTPRNPGVARPQASVLCNRPDRNAYREKPPKVIPNDVVVFDTPGNAYYSYEFVKVEKSLQPSEIFVDALSKIEGVVRYEITGLGNEVDVYVRLGDRIARHNVYDLISEMIDQYPGQFTALVLDQMP